MGTPTGDQTLNDIDFDPKVRDDKLVFDGMPWKSWCLTPWIINLFSAISCNRINFYYFIILLKLTQDIYKLLQEAFLTTFCLWIFLFLRICFVLLKLFNFYSRRETQSHPALQHLGLEPQTKNPYRDIRNYLHHHTF